MAKEDRRTEGGSGTGVRNPGPASPTGTTGGAGAAVDPSNLMGTDLDRSRAGDKSGAAKGEEKTRK
jgi:hypothetical protein